MRITCWGARGSVPVCGPNYVRYGGATACLEIRGPEDQLIIVDAGYGIRGLGNNLIGRGPVQGTLLITHAHWDHISGFPFFKPVHDETTRLEIICCAFKREFTEKMLASTMAPPYFPVPLTQVKAQISYPRACDDSFVVGGLTVEAIRLSHPNGGVGYKFSQGERSFVFLTDNELSFRHPNGVKLDDYRRFCQEADLLVHDAEYTPQEYAKVEGWGHSTYVDALELALTAGVKRFALFHHNQDRTDEQMDQLVEDCRRRVAETGRDLEVMAMSIGLSLEV